MMKQDQRKSESEMSPLFCIPESGAPFNGVEAVIYRRRSVRVYKKKQIPEYLVKRLLETARFTPSAGNGQTWKFVVIQDHEIIEEMENDVIQTCRKISRLFYYLKDGSKTKRFFTRLFQWLNPATFHPVPYIAAHMIAEGRAGVFHGAPTVILILVDKRAPGDSAIEAGIAGETMVLAAHSYGLGTCWVSFANLLFRGSNKRKWKKRFDIKYPYVPVTTLVAGYPAGKPDGYVARETKKTDWFAANGTFKVVS